MVRARIKTHLHLTTVRDHRVPQAMRKPHRYNSVRLAMKDEERRKVLHLLLKRIRSPTAPTEEVDYCGDRRHG